jgi:hypothetical protein
MRVDEFVDTPEVFAPFGLVQPEIGACAGTRIVLVDYVVDDARSAQRLDMPDSIPKVRCFDRFGNVLVVVGSPFAHV